jgi:hypothetical protein
MRNLLRSLCLVVLSVSAAFAGAPPSVTAQDAARLADEYLKERGLLASTYIQSITIEQAALLKPDRHWLVKWDAPIAVEGMRKKEIGLKITFEGKVTRLVD